MLSVSIVSWGETIHAVLLVSVLAMLAVLARVNHAANSYQVSNSKLVNF